MGMFSKMFGKSGSDKADRMRQMAIDAFNAIKTPALRDLQVQLDQYVQQGVLSPEQAEAELLSSNAFSEITTDPALSGAQKQALSSLQEVANGGGLTAIDKSRMADITAEQNATARGRNESIMQGARERGMGSSDMNTINQLMSEQAAADRASRQGTSVAAEAQARALQAMIAAGDTAGKIRGQEFGEEAQKAQAENAIDLFNKQTLNQTNLYNVDTVNRADAANLAAKQAISEANVATGNQNKMYNAQQNQVDFNNKMAKAQGVAGTYNGWAADANADAKADHAADVGFTTGLIKAGATGAATMFGGPAAGMAVSGATSDIGGGNSTHSGYTYDNVVGGQKRKAYSDGGMVEEDPMARPGEFLNPTQEDLSAEAMGMANGGMVKDFREGGEVPGDAPMAGDHPANDTVPAQLSPGELVVPRSAMSDEDEFEQFMQQFKPQKRTSKMDESVPMEHQALANLHKRISALEGR